MYLGSQSNYPFVFLDNFHGNPIRGLCLFSLTISLGMIVRISVNYRIIIIKSEESLAIV